MSENTISTLKKEIASFFKNIGLTVEFKNRGGWEPLDFNIGQKSYSGIWSPDTGIFKLFVNTGKEVELLHFIFNVALPSGEKLQPLYHEIKRGKDSQLVFLTGSCSFPNPSDRLSYEHYETLVYYYSSYEVSHSGSVLQFRKGDILLRHIEDDKVFEDQLLFARSVINRLIPDIQFKSKVPEIQDWIEKQVA